MFKLYGRGIAGLTWCHDHEGGERELTGGVPVVVGKGDYASFAAQ
jgi:hypothetical protein